MTANTYYTYTCEGCGATFSGSPTEGFDLGWDLPPHGFQHTTCPNCLMSTTVWWKVAIDKQEPTLEDIALLNRNMALMMGVDPDTTITPGQ